MSCDSFSSQNMHCITTLTWSKTRGNRTYFKVLEELYDTWLHLLFRPSTALGKAFIFTPGLMWNCGLKEMLFDGNAAFVIHSEENKTDTEL